MGMVPANGIAPNAGTWLLLAEEMHAGGTAGSASDAIAVTIALMHAWSMDQ